MGVVIIFAVTGLITPRDIGPWQVAAITAIIVGIIHGVIFWLVSRRQRAVRLQTVADIQATLKNVINNPLTVIQGMDYLRTADPAQTQHATAQIARCVTSISDALHHLSEESLKAWQNKYVRHS